MQTAKWIPHLRSDEGQTMRRRILTVHHRTMRGRTDAVFGTQMREGALNICDRSRSMSNGR
ncbi:hypothetical protein DFG55_14440 [Xanthomonas campestris pv. campestris]|nr:hypothetical protein AEA01_14630 [Xanthomonas campestris pv. campestris]QCX67456.1 hypothetical protein DFG55_14440 [Xanthomonas campestris pv. campestris]QCX72049.1 hypothetical protein DFG54_15985 [Xanthomonas campestris pv. campestris]